MPHRNQGRAMPGTPPTYGDEQFNSEILEINKDREGIFKDMALITEKAVQRWDEKIKLLSPKAANTGESRLLIWYILCHIYSNIGKKKSITELSRELSGMYKQDTIRKKLKELRKDGIVKYQKDPEEHFQISKIAEQAIEDQLKYYLNGFCKLAQRAADANII
jgi:hypothetical protein